MTLHLKINPVTGKKDLIISLRSDDDALPHEHEQMHKELVDKLIEGGALKAGELGRIILQRDEDESKSLTSEDAPAQEERRSQSAGN
jgi:hypothetical protein